MLPEGARTAAAVAAVRRDSGSDSSLALPLMMHASVDRTIIATWCGVEQYATDSELDESVKAYDDRGRGSTWVGRGWGLTLRGTPGSFPLRIRLQAAGEFERAAFVAVVHSNLRRAVSALQASPSTPPGRQPRPCSRGGPLTRPFARPADDTHKLLAAALAGYVRPAGGQGGRAPNSMWRDSMTALAATIQDPHLKAVLASTFADGVGQVLAIPG